MWSKVKVGEFGDEVRVAFAGALVWGDVDPEACEHASQIAARL